MARHPPRHRQKYPVTATVTAHVTTHVTARHHPRHRPARHPSHTLPTENGAGDADARWGLAPVPYHPDLPKNQILGSAKIKSNPSAKPKILAVSHSNDRADQTAKSPKTPNRQSIRLNRSAKPTTSGHNSSQIEQTAKSQCHDGQNNQKRCAMFHRNESRSARAGSIARNRRCGDARVRTACVGRESPWGSRGPGGRTHQRSILWRETACGYLVRCSRAIGSAVWRSGRHVPTEIVVLRADLVVEEARQTGHPAGRPARITRPRLSRASHFTRPGGAPGSAA
jgi:hypothetical protein